MSWNGGKTRNKRIRADKPYERRQVRSEGSSGSGASLISRLTSTVTSLLPGGWLPSWLADDATVTSNSSSVPSTSSAEQLSLHDEERQTSHDSASTSVNAAVAPAITTHRRRELISSENEASGRQSSRSSTRLNRQRTLPSTEFPSADDIEPRNDSTGLTVLSDEASARLSSALADSMRQRRNARRLGNVETDDPGSHGNTAGLATPRRTAASELSTVNQSDVNLSLCQKRSHSPLSETPGAGDSSLLSSSVAAVDSSPKHSRLFSNTVKRARFNPASLNASLQLDDSTCSTGTGSTSLMSRTFCGVSSSPRSSPFYPGVTMYGGASNHRRLRVIPPTVVAPYQVRSRGASIVSGGDLGMSSSSRRILAALERVTTPVGEALLHSRSSSAAATPPASTSVSSKLLETSFSNQRRSSLYGSLGARLGGRSTPRPESGSTAPPVHRTAPPQRCHIAENHAPKTISDPVISTADTKLVSASTNATPDLGVRRHDRHVTFTADTPSMETSSAGGKMRRVKEQRHYRAAAEYHDEPAVPSLPPNISLSTPAPLKPFSFNTSTPKVVTADNNNNDSSPAHTGSSPVPFHFSLPLSSGVAVSPVSDEFSNINTSTPEFTFSAPIPVVSSVAAHCSPAASTTVSTVTSRSSPPASSLLSSVTVSTVSSVSVLTQSLSPAKSCPSSSASPLNQTPSLSSSRTALDVQSAASDKQTNGHLPLVNSWAGKFSKPVGQWTCDTCMVSNAASDSACIACQSPNPNASKKTKTAPVNVDTFSSLKTDNSLKKLSAAPKGWECDTCLVQNRAAVDRCVACQSLKPGSVAASTKPTSGGFSFGFSNDQAKPTVAATSLSGGFVFGSSASDVTPKTSEPKFSFGVAKEDTTSMSTAKPSGGFVFGSEPISTTATVVTSSSGFVFGSPKGDSATKVTGFAFDSDSQKTSAADTAVSTESSTVVKSSSSPICSSTLPSVLSSVVTTAAEKPTTAFSSATFAFGRANDSTSTPVSVAADSPAFPPVTVTPSVSMGVQSSNQTLPSTVGDIESVTAVTKAEATQNLAVTTASKPAFVFGTAGVSTVVSTTASGLFAFGAAPALTTSSVTSSNTQSSTAVSSTNLFAFGSSSVSKPSSTTAPSTLSFSFGAPASSSVGSSAFGGSVSSTTVAATTTSSSSSTPAPPVFTFGQPSVNQSSTGFSFSASTGTSSTSPAAGIFSFGGAKESAPKPPDTTPLTSTGSSSTPSGVFSFGSAATNNGPTQAPAPFVFGAAAAVKPVDTAPATSALPAPNAFSFGSSAAPPSSSITMNSAPGGTQSTVPGAFSFGSSGGVGGSTQQNSVFGAPGPAAPSVPAAPFTFDAPKPAANAPFAFGGAASGSGGASFNSAPPAFGASTGVFAFGGAAAPAAAPAPSAGFNFGASAAPPTSFNFNSGQPASTPSVFQFGVQAPNSGAAGMTTNPPVFGSAQPPAMSSNPFDVSSSAGSVGQRKIKTARRRLRK